MFTKFAECIITPPASMEIVLHEPNLLAKPVSYDLILKNTLDSWSFLNSIAEDLVADGELTPETVGYTLELYSYDFLSTKYTLEGSVPLFGVIDNNNEFYILLQDNPSIGNNFLNKLPRMEVNFTSRGEVYNRLNFQSVPYSQNGSDILIYNKKHIFMCEMKLWRK